MRDDGGVRPPSPRGQPVGDAEYGDVDLHGRALAQVSIYGAARERRLVDEKAQAQVVPGQGGQVIGEPLACPQAEQTWIEVVRGMPVPARLRARQDVTQRSRSRVRQNSVPNHAHFARLIPGLGDTGLREVVITCTT